VLFAVLIVSSKIPYIISRCIRCFLATYYFTQNLIKSDIDESLFPENINAFIEIYGAYLQIHTCLLFAASAEDEIAISLILKIAKHDPTHRHAYKEIQNFSDLLFYDQVSSNPLAVFE
tara:strand:+ start:553 stop:906 length:354 start_codon:yes stop_codon:yes gene_type:complete